MSALKQVTDASFEQDVLNSSGLTLVDFWAPWCGPCRMLGPTLEQIQAENPNLVNIVKFNVDENPNFAARYRVMNIPLMILFKDGEMVDQKMGNLPKAQVLNFINSNA